MLVLAHNSLCVRAPWPAKLAKAFALKLFFVDLVSDLCAGDGNLPVSFLRNPALAHLLLRIIFSRIGSTITSIRLRKKLATEAIRSTGWPRSTRLSRADR